MKRETGRWVEDYDKNVDLRKARFHLTFKDVFWCPKEKTFQNHHTSPWQSSFSKLYVLYSFGWKFSNSCKYWWPQTWVYGTNRCLETDLFIPQKPMCAFFSVLIFGLVGFLSVPFTCFILSSLWSPLTLWSRSPVSPQLLAGIQYSNTQR